LLEILIDSTILRMVYALVVIIGEGSDENLTGTPHYEH
jgi:hypothetical protein